MLYGLQEKAIAGQLWKMNNLDCISAYARQAQVQYSNLLLVTAKNNSSNSAPVQRIYMTDPPSSMYNLEGNWLSAGSATYQSPEPTSDGWYNTAPDPVGWICGGKNTTLPYPQWSWPDNPGGPCEGGKLDHDKANADHWSPFNETVNYCLSEPAVHECRLYANFLLILVVVCTNIIQIIALVVVILRSKSRPLLTIGDALSSFLEDPDGSTRDMCLASSHHFRLLNYEKREWRPLLTCWVPKKRFWCSTVRVGRWLSALGL